MIDPAIKQYIDERLQQAAQFHTKKIGDTPTDDYQLTPKKYVDAQSGGSPGGPINSVQYRASASDFGGNVGLTFDATAFAQTLTLKNDNSTVGMDFSVVGSNAVIRSLFSQPMYITSGSSGHDVNVIGGYLDATGDVFLNSTLQATTINKGFIFIPSCAGTPTGTPGAGTPLIYDTSANKLWIYNSGWKFAQFT